ncbi:MAG: YlbF family regulator [Butyribacter sp.]|nr:YlbF family regulator [bacterium]MDY3854272.1 YlbF family regulator [Butyribacter sp.]
MSEVEELMAQIVKKLPMTKEYNQYKDVLNRVKAKPDLYHRIGEFRRKSMEIRMSGNGNTIQAMNELQKEFQDLQNNALSADFFVAEHQYCRMIQELENQFLEGAQIETDFLEK